MRVVRPATRRIYSNVGIELAAVVGRARHRDAVRASTCTRRWCEPLRLTATTLAGRPRGTACERRRPGRAGAGVPPPVALLTRPTLPRGAPCSIPACAEWCPGFGAQDPNDWGLGFEIRGHKSPHWTGSAQLPGDLRPLRPERHDDLDRPGSGVGAGRAGRPRFGRGQPGRGPRSRTPCCRRLASYIRGRSRDAAMRPAPAAPRSEGADVQRGVARAERGPRLRLSSISRTTRWRCPRQGASNSSICSSVPRAPGQEVHDDVRHVEVAYAHRVGMADRPLSGLGGRPDPDPRHELQPRHRAAAASSTHSSSHRERTRRRGRHAAAARRRRSGASPRSGPAAARQGGRYPHPAGRPGRRGAVPVQQLPPRATRLRAGDPLLQDRRHELSKTRPVRREPHSRVVPAGRPAGAREIQPGPVIPLAEQRGNPVQQPLRPRPPGGGAHHTVPTQRSVPVPPGSCTPTRTASRVEQMSRIAGPADQCATVRGRSTGRPAAQTLLRRHPCYSRARPPGAGLNVGGEPDGAVREFDVGPHPRAGLQLHAARRCGPGRRSPRPRARSRRRRPRRRRSPSAAPAHRLRPGAVEQDRTVDDRAGRYRARAPIALPPSDVAEGATAAPCSTIASPGGAGGRRGRCPAPGRRIRRRSRPACRGRASSRCRGSPNTRAPSASSSGNVSRSTETGRPVGMSSTTGGGTHSARVDLVGDRVRVLLQERRGPVRRRRSARSRTRAGPRPWSGAG